MKWIFLLTAGLFEIVFATGFGKLKTASGSMLILWVTVVLVSMGFSLLLLYKASQEIPMGIAYAIWTGVGAGGAVLAAFFFLHEPMHAWKIFFLVLLLLSIAGLRLTSH